MVLAPVVLFTPPNYTVCTALGSINTQLVLTAHSFKEFLEDNYIVVQSRFLKTFLYEIPVSGYVLGNLPEVCLIKGDARLISKNGVIIG